MSSNYGNALCNVEQVRRIFESHAVVGATDLTRNDCINELLLRN